jgi:hypothetical protein
MLLFAMPVLFGFAALAIDLAMVQYARQELQIGVDAAALAGAAALMEAAPPPSWADGGRREVIRGESNFMARQRQVAAARDEATRYAARNPVLYRPISLATNRRNFRDGDVNIGWVEDPRDLACEMTPPNGAGPVNSVSVRGAQTRHRGNPVSLWFGRAVGFAHMDVLAAARATVDQRLYGFRPLGTVQAPLVPVLVECTDAELAQHGRNNWPRPIAGRREDNDRFSVDVRSGDIQLGSDGIPEFTMLIGRSKWNKSRAETRRGIARVLMIDGEQSDDARIQRQILSGLNTDDLVSFGGQFALTEEGRLGVTEAAVNTLQLAELRQSLLAIRGQKRAWPLGARSPDSTGDTQCEVTGFAAGCVIDCRQESNSSLAIVVQPCWLQTCTALTRQGEERNPWIGKLMMTR